MALIIQGSLASLIQEGSHVAASVLQALQEVQTEVLVFTVALLAHAVVFSKTPARKQPSKKALSPRLGSWAAGSKDAKEKEDKAKANSNHSTRMQGMQISAAQTAEEALARFEALPPGADLLRSCEKAGRMVAEAALDRGRPDLLVKLEAGSEIWRSAKLLKSIFAERGLQAARQIFEACPEKTSLLRNTLLDACIEAKDMAAAERVMKSTIEAGAVDVYTYSSMIKAHLKSRDVSRAHTEFKAMCASGLTPNVFIYNELIDAMAATHREGAWRLVGEMRANGTKPSQVTCSIMLKRVRGKAMSAELDKVLALFEDASEGEAMDEVLLSSVCEACIRAGRDDLLLPQLRRFEEQDLPMTGMVFVGSLIRAYSFVRDMRGVWATWRKMSAAGIVPTSVTIGCMVEAVVANGGPEAGKALLGDMHSDPATRPLLNAVCFNSILKGFSSRGQFDRAWTLYEEMQAETEYPHRKPNGATYNVLIDVCAKSKDAGRIPALLKSMVRQGVEPSVVTFATLVKCYSAANLIEKAVEVMEEMKRAGLRPDEITYNSVLDGCARNGFFDTGLHVLKDMQKAGVPPSNYTLVVLVKLATRQYRIDWAFEISEEISRKHNFRLNVHVFNGLIHCCLQHHYPDRALAVFCRMLQERCQPDWRTYSMLVQSSIRRGDAEEAAALLRAAAGVPDPHPLLECAGGTAALWLHDGLPKELASSGLEGIATLNQSLARALASQLQPGPSAAGTQQARSQLRPPQPEAPTAARRWAPKKGLALQYRSPADGAERHPADGA